MKRYAAAAVLIFALGAAADARGQTGGLPFRDAPGPIEITVDGNIQWKHKTKTVVAQGNARARQEDVTLRADTITARYRASKDGGAELWHIVAEGNVRIDAPDRTATARKGTYDVDRRVLVLTGKPRLRSGTGRIAAERSLEYWQARKVAVARGNATAEQGGRTIVAQTLTATLENDGKGGDGLARIEGSGGITFTSPGEFLRADRAAYDAAGERLVAEGSVEIVRESNRLNGEAAEIDLKKGISRLYGGQRGVKGLFTPTIPPDADRGEDG